MFKKIKYLLKNFDTIKAIVEEHEKAPKKNKPKRVSLEGVPEEQRKYIEENFKIERS
jgi:hypothetical protein